MSTGLRLKEERERLGQSQERFSAVGGVQKRAQINYEKGERNPDSAYLAALAGIGVDVLYVITGRRAASSAEEEFLLDRYRNSSPEVRQAALGALVGAVMTMSMGQAMTSHMPTVGASHSSPPSKKVRVSAKGGHAAGRDMSITNREETDGKPKSRKSARPGGGT